MTGVEPTGLLSTVERREELLRALGDGPLEKPALEERVDVSRSTIDRGIRDLETFSLVSRVDGGYRRTLPGRIALEEYDRFQRRVEGLCDGTGLLTSLPASVGLDGDLLAGAEVVGTSRTAPGRPVEALYDVVDRAESVRGFGPAVHEQQVETYRRRVFDEGMDADLVLTDAALERLVADYGGLFEDALAHDAVDVWRTPETLPYSLTLADTCDAVQVGVLVYGEEGVQGCIINDEPAAVEWGERRYEELRATAAPVG